MANDFSRLPNVIDTAMTVTYQNSTPPNNLSLYPLKIYWENPAASGDTFVIQDSGGKTIFLGRCEASNQSQYFDVAVNTKWTDYKVSTLASGVIYLWFKT